MRRCSFEIPLVMNVKSRGVVVWLTGKGRTYVDKNGVLCGLSADTQHRLKIETREERIPKESTTPEAWVFSNWPAILLLERVESRQTWQAGVEHPFGGRIWGVTPVGVEGLTR